MPKGYKATMDFRMNGLNSKETSKDFAIWTKTGKKEKSAI